MLAPRKLLVALSVAALCTLPALAAPAEKPPKASDVLLPDGYLPLTDADRALASVAFAPGAPAVVLLQGAQYQWEENFVRTRFVRRVKLLTEAGVDHANHSHSFTGDWRMGSVRARTILPDGTEVDASANVHVESSKDPDMTLVKVTFPRAQPGAILDLALDANANNVSLREWVVQQGIPVLESRLLLVPGMGDRYRTALARMKPEEVKAHDIRYGTKTLFAWIFRDVPPLATVPNSLPVGDIAKKLVMTKESYRYGSVAVQIASTWPQYCKDIGTQWDSWLRKRSAACAQLGVQSAGAALTPAAKAEAVRQALRSRMTAAYEDYFPSADTPDEALDHGKGNSADVAGVAIAMLAGVDVKAHVAAYRRRDSGALPTEYPMPSMLDDVLVVVPGAGENGKDLLFAADSDLPAGHLPPEALGVFIVPFRKDSPGPIFIADPPADANATRRTTSLTLALDGSVSGETRIMMSGSSAAAMRARLSRLPVDDRKRELESDLRVLVPSAVASSATTSGLDTPAKDVEITLSWEAPGLAAGAGARMLLNPFLFDRLSAEDWAAESRDFDIWLGRPYVLQDDVTITMPQGIASVQLPAGAKLEAEKVGGYSSEFSGKDMTLRASRTIRFEQTLFPASAWAPLKGWFQDMAKADDQAIVFTVAEGAR